MRSDRWCWLGWGLIWAVYYVGIDAGTLFEVAGCIRMPNDSFSAAALIASTVSFGTIALLSVTKGSSVCSSRGMVSLSYVSWGVALTFTRFAPSLFGLGPDSMNLVFIVSGAISGIAFSYLSLSYQLILLSRAKTSTALYLARAMMAIPVAYLVIWALPPTSSFLAVIISLIVSACIGARQSSIVHRSDAGAKSGFRLFSLQWPILLSVCLGSVLFEAVRQISYTMEWSFDDINVIAIFATLIAAVLFSIVVRFWPKANVLVVLSGLFMIAGGALVVLPLSNSLVVLCCMLSVRMVMGFGEVALFSLLLSTQRSSNVNAVLSTALSHAAISVGYAIGALPAWFLEGGFSSFEISLVSTGSLYVLMIIVVVLFRTSRMEAYASSSFSVSGDSAKEEACREIAREKGLSPREREVFELLIQGRSGPYIATELYVSVSTVKSHTAHIYKKLAVNSKQELIDMVLEKTQRSLSEAKVAAIKKKT